MGAAADKIGKYDMRRNKTVFENNPELKLHKEFCVLQDIEMRYVILSTHPDSPYFNQPERTRKKYAAMGAGYSTNSDGHDMLGGPGYEITLGKKADVEEAILKLREILGVALFEDQETIDAVQTQIDNIKSVLKKDTSDTDELKKRSALANELPKLKATLRELQIKTGTNVGAVDVEDETEEKELSMLDRVNMEEQGDAI